MKIGACDDHIGELRYMSRLIVSHGKIVKDMTVLRIASMEAKLKGS